MRRAALVLAATLLAAGAASAQPKGGTLVFAVSAEPPTYDCHAGNTFTILHHVSPHYSLLIKFDPDRQGEFAPDLAKSWEVSADGLTYTVRLHADVEFHD